MTTIDSLQIEIQSTSGNAARGIDELAGSLKRLKENGTISVAVKNLNNLRKALHSFANIPSNASKVLSLAQSLEKLKSVGTVASLGNSITKLATSLKSLDSVDVGSVGPQIQKIADAVQPLSTLKAGGLSTMINALGKIGKVTESLDDEKIDAFAERIEKLNEKLEPLSQKMTTIQAGLKGINSSARSAGNGVKEMGEEVDGAKVNFAGLIYIVQEAVQAIQQVIEKFSQIIGQAIEWDGISARFGRGFGAEAKDTYEWVQRLNEEMGINIQTFMQYSSVYATMLSGFGVSMEDASKMALGYTELTYDIWAGYNDIYKHFEDAAEAVKSAIAGEVEPIRRAGFTIVEATLEQTAANHGLEISLANATEAQKSYLRYLTLVDQAYDQNLVGTYSKEMYTAEGLTRTLSQQIKSLSQAFGSLFLPILVKIIPYIQAFVELITEAVHWIAGLFGITIQGVDWSGIEEGTGAIGGVADSAGAATDALGSAAKAAKELKNATLGIDELNVISPASAVSGSGGSGSVGGGGTGFEDLDVDSLWDESIFANIGNQVDKIKEKIQAWLPLIEAAAIAFGALGIVALLASMGESLAALSAMQGEVALLKKALAGLAILTIEAVLVFMLSDNYLETGNLMSLVGEALATAAGGYLMYKGFGAKGLVMSLAVSMAMQLASITMNLADGGVDFDDPQLWIQSALTAATGGVAGGFLAYKGLIPVSTGQGVGLGLLAGLSLTLAAITIGEVTANGEVTAGSIFTGIGSVLSAAGFGFMVGGPAGAAIGAAVALTINVVGAAIGVFSTQAKMDLEADLNSRFGDVELSTSEIKVLVEKLTPEWADETALANSLREDVDAELERIEKLMGEMGAYEWQIGVGIGLTQDEMKSYQNVIDSFVAACQSYVSERGYALDIGLKATTSTESIIASANSVSATATGELQALGKKLQDTVNEAYSDGLLDVDELEVIQTIRNDMQEIVNALASSEIEAEFSMLEMKWSGVDLTPESYKSMTAEWADTLKNKVKPALEKTVKENLKTLEGNIAYLKLALEKAPDNEILKKDLEDAEQALQDYIDENPLENLTIEANVKAVSIAVNTLRDAFSDEIALIEKEGYLEFPNALKFALRVMPDVKFDVGDGDIYGRISMMVQTMASEYESASYSMSKEARKNLEKMLESMKPTMADFEELAEENRKAGKTVPESVRAGLSDYNELLAIAGDVEGINYLIGKGFTTDPVFLNTLVTAENAGLEIDKYTAAGILDNLDYVRDSATGLVTEIKSAITGESIRITPELIGNLAQMGVNMGDALGDKYTYVYDEATGLLQSITDAVTGEQVWVNKELKSSGEEAAKNLKDGLSNELEKKEDTSFWGKITNWAGGVLETMKKAFKINSPSKATKEMGGYLSDGLSDGMELNTVKDKLSDMWSTAKKWWNGKSGLSAYTPDIGSIKTKLSSAWGTAKEWWTKSKSKLSTYTPSIGSVKTKLSSSWDTAKKWWSKSKGSLSYTPTIGNIKDKLSSSWNTAKKWWSNNVKLSVPSLGFKVSYSKPSGMVNKAIVKALGLDGWPKISFAANGGMFDMGSLVWAGERGPEVLANAGGGKTGVMNVDQMQDAVYEGVYAAVMAAMRTSSGNGGNQAVNVYLDGRQIAATVEKRQGERGANIMGTQVYNYG